MELLAAKKPQELDDLFGEADGDVGDFFVAIFETAAADGAH